jgi:hypothetical protein
MLTHRGVVFSSPDRVDNGGRDREPRRAGGEEEVVRDTALNGETENISVVLVPRPCSLDLPARYNVKRG